jgi:vesicle-fusing ATPase
VVIINSVNIFKNTTNKKQKISNDINMSSYIRDCCSLELDTNVNVDKYDYNKLKLIHNIIIEVNSIGYQNKVLKLKGDDLRKKVNGLIVNKSNQRFAILLDDGTKLSIRVIEAYDNGFIDDETAIFVSGKGIKDISGNGGNGIDISLNTNYEKLGVGGMNKEFITIFRRAFISRVMPRDIIEKLGVKHIRGMIMFGPPGCGKTLSARVISKMLNCKNEPKIISGPEIFGKYVGESEGKVRELFKDAEDNPSDFHVIIIDEMDAMCRKRGSSGSDGGGRVSDSVVNQLLAKIDGVDSLDNILIIGMTNRLDVIDPALLRPGRFEVQIEIGLPDKEGRYEILKIHTKTMSDGNVLSDDVNLSNIATETNNFTGAEIEGLVKSAVSFATQRHVDIDDMSNIRNIEDIKITKADFDRAITEIMPAFGVSDSSELKLMLGNGIIDIWNVFNEFEKELKSSIFKRQQKNISILLHGPRGCGKTALLGRIGLEYNIPFVKLISAASMISMTETQQCNEIISIFNDASRSSDAIILIDDLERIIEFVKMGNRFSNKVLQCILIMINKSVENNITVVITTSIDIYIVEQLGIKVDIDLIIPVPSDENVKCDIVKSLNFHKSASMIDGVPVPIKCFYY